MHLLAFTASPCHCSFAEIDSIFTHALPCCALPILASKQLCPFLDSEGDRLRWQWAHVRCGVRSRLGAQECTAAGSCLPWSTWPRSAKRCAVLQAGISFVVGAGNYNQGTPPELAISCHCCSANFCASWLVCCTAHSSMELDILGIVLHHQPVCL